ncbi:MAG TPA: alkaline phosphatase family protein [Pirellulales bacterium]|jgi:phospholipase C|nr:alkaline phosphatase family protein [Pirellulales bacterium]
MKTFLRTVRRSIPCSWLWAVGCLLIAAAAQAAEPAAALATFRQKVHHIIVIYQENWSFDGLYGKFPGANGLENAKATAKQTDRRDRPYQVLPQPLDTDWSPPIPDRRFPLDLPVGPFDLSKFVKPEDKTGDLIHRFYREQYQIHGGKMDHYVAWSDAGGLVMSYYDATNLPEGKLAQEFTLCDNFFHAAFGGSFLNHIWLVAAASPTWPEAPPELLIRKDPNHFADGVVTDDGYAVNTCVSINHPHPLNAKNPKYLLPSIKLPTIGDRLSDKKIDWAWYSGGWNRALAGDPDPEFNSLFQFHHQPFVYFESFADGTQAKKDHLKDEQDFFAATKAGNLPPVCFVKPFGADNEHPGYASLSLGQQHVADLVEAVRKSKLWNDSVIVICYDENGGRWDHVPPPKIDRWGPGTRVPAIVISPFAKRGFIDHTQYDTTAVLKLIEERYDLSPLGARDRDTGDLLHALQF